MTTLKESTGISLQEYVELCSKYAFGEISYEQMKFIINNKKEEFLRNKNANVKI